MMHKSRLYEYTQRHGLPLPTYRTSVEGSTREQRFRSTVSVDGVEYTTPPSFLNRKSAEQGAARLAMESIVQNSKAVGFPVILQDTLLCKSVLHEYAAKMGLPLPSYETVRVNGPLPLFQSTVNFNGGSTRGVARGSKKDGEQSAARAVIVSLLADPETAFSVSEIINSKLRLCAALDEVKDPCEGSALPVASVCPGGGEPLGSDSHSAKRRKTNCNEESSDDQENAVGEGVSTRNGSAAAFSEGKQVDDAVLLDSMTARTLLPQAPSMPSSNHELVQVSAMLPQAPGTHSPHYELPLASAVPPAAPEMHPPCHVSVAATALPPAAPGMHMPPIEFRDVKLGTHGDTFSLPTIGFVKPESEQPVAVGPSSAKKKKKKGGKGKGSERLLTDGLPAGVTPSSEENEVQAAVVLDCRSTASPGTHVLHHQSVQANALTATPVVVLDSIPPANAMTDSKDVTLDSVPTAAPGTHVSHHQFSHANASTAASAVVSDSRSTAAPGTHVLHHQFAQANASTTAPAVVLDSVPLAAPETHLMHHGSLPENAMTLAAPVAQPHSQFVPANAIPPAASGFHLPQHESLPASAVSLAAPGTQLALYEFKIVKLQTHEEEISLPITFVKPESEQSEDIAISSARKSRRKKKKPRRHIDGLLPVAATPVCQPHHVQWRNE
ncbi:hypothetical protein Tsubulata_003714 [Turnera subulata]|uniref:DRBM domain-containing protein n=1 Tax=Turnera subulata TaxID=218843 RepID=A0A9Q0GEJ4_9ROSI|nr:hypothetical protein Tsubulata_003714 [Turnera subulata]